MPGRDKGKHLFNRGVDPALGLAAVSIYAIFTGCSTGPPASASISQARQINLYEGLPHQFYEPKALIAEKKAKPTVELNGFTFYSETLELKAGDAEELKALLAGSRSFVALTGEKKCGGFHPDYAVEWSVGGETYRCLICLGCLEARFHGPGGTTEYDIEDATFKRLKQLFMPYRKNRPAASQEIGVRTNSDRRTGLSLCQTVTARNFVHADHLLWVLAVARPVISALA